MYTFLLVEVFFFWFILKILFKSLKSTDNPFPLGKTHHMVYQKVSKIQPCRQCTDNWGCFWDISHIVFCEINDCEILDAYVVP